MKKHILHVKNNKKHQKSYTEDLTISNTLKSLVYHNQIYNIYIDGVTRNAWPMSLL